MIPLRNTTATFTRPADTTAYASGDLVATSTTAGSVVPLTFQVSRSRDGSVIVWRARVRKSGTGLTNAQFRLHLYDAATITCANGDNAAWSTNGVAGYLGYIDVTIDKAFTDGAYGDGVPLSATQVAEILVKLSTRTTILGLLEARAAYAPASAEVFTVTLELAPVT
jgi:hypothetical protein